MKEKINQHVFWAAAIAIVVTLLAICLGFFAGISSLDKNSKPHSDTEQGAASGLIMPEEMKKIAQDTDVEWMSGIWVDLPDYERQELTDETGVDTFICKDKRINATVVLQNGLEQTQPYYLLVLADGIPTNFVVENETYVKYSLMLSSQQTTLNIELEPYFCNNLGRLDFLLLYDGNPLSDYHMTGYTICLKRSSGSDDFALPENLFSTIEQREGLLGAYEDGAYDAWLWDNRDILSKNAHSGPRELTIDSQSSITFEAVAAKAGLYRTILLLNGETIAFVSEGDTFNYCDWVSKEKEMLQIPVQMDFFSEETAGFFTISTPLDAENISCKSLASKKIQLIYRK